MKLNEISYTHKLIRNYCTKLEEITGLQKVTNLSEDFNEIQYIGKYSYIIIEYREKRILVLAYKLNAQEMSLIEDIILYLHWLEFVPKYQKRNK